MILSVSQGTRAVDGSIRSAGKPRSHLARGSHRVADWLLPAHARSSALLLRRARPALRHRPVDQVLEKPVLEEKVKMLKEQEDHVNKAYLDLLEKNNTRKLPASEEQHLKNYPLQLKQIKAEIAKGEDKLEAIKVA